MSRRSTDPPGNRRLDSWKEIASFFGRDERTVKRWERSRALPVHRIPGGERGGVFAYTDELNLWLHAPTNAAEIPPQQPDPTPPDIAMSDSSPAVASPLPAPEPEPAPEPATRDPRAVQPWITRAVLLCGVALAVIFLIHLLPLRMHGVASRPILHNPLVSHLQNAEAEELYLRGRYYWNRRTGDDLNHAVDDFTQAIAHDPSDAKAYAGLADSYNLLREFSSVPDSVAYPRAMAAASKAVALDDSLAEGHRALAFALFFWKWDVPNALREYQKAIQLDPKNVESHHWYATTLLDLGRFNESLSEIEQARTLEPSSPAILADRGLILYSAGDQAGGIAALKEIEKSEPQFLSPPRYLATAFLSQGDYPDFLRELSRVAAISKDSQDQAIVKAARNGWSTGGKQRMLLEMQKAQQVSFEGGHSTGYELAYTCLLLGQKANAIHFLQAAFRAHDPRLFAISRDRFQADLKGDPGFEQLKLQIQKYEQ